MFSLKKSSNVKTVLNEERNCLCWYYAAKTHLLNGKLRRPPVWLWGTSLCAALQTSGPRAGNFCSYLINSYDYLWAAQRKKMQRQDAPESDEPCDVTGWLNVAPNLEGQDETCTSSHVSEERTDNTWQTLLLFLFSFFNISVSLFLYTSFTLPSSSSSQRCSSRSSCRKGFEQLVLWHFFSSCSCHVFSVRSR